MKRRILLIFSFALASSGWYFAWDASKSLKYAIIESQELKAMFVSFSQERPVIEALRLKWKCPIGLSFLSGVLPVCKPEFEVYRNQDKNKVLDWVRRGGKDATHDIFEQNGVLNRRVRLDWEPVIIE